MQSDYPGAAPLALRARRGRDTRGQPPRGVVLALSVPVCLR